VPEWVHSIAPCQAAGRSSHWRCCQGSARQDVVDACQPVSASARAYSASSQLDCSWCMLVLGAGRQRCWCRVTPLVLQAWPPLLPVAEVKCVCSTGASAAGHTAPGQQHSCAPSSWWAAQTQHLAGLVCIPLVCWQGSRCDHVTCCRMVCHEGRAAAIWLLAAVLVWQLQGNQVDGLRRRGLTARAQWRRW
jgi:hypothetical protein